MEHSSNCKHLQDIDGCKQHFTAHIEYEIPRIGNRFKMVLRQKQCDCNCLSDHSFEIYEDLSHNTFTTNETTFEHQLSQTMSDVLTLNEEMLDITENKSNETKQDFIWIQILSSIKGIQLNYNKNVF